MLGSGLAVRVSIGEGVNVRVAGSVSVGGTAVTVSVDAILVVVRLVAALGDAVDCSEWEGEQESVTKARHRMISRYPFFIPSLYYCF